MTAVTAKRLPSFERFIAELRTIFAEKADDETHMRKAKPVLERFLSDPDLYAHSKAWPDTVGQNLLFYEDPDYHFVINGVVRPPQYKGGVHDHANAWVLYGVLDGIETLERFERVDDRTRPDYAEVRLASATKGERGKVDIVPPFNIHAELGGPVRSVGLIVRSERLVGRIQQGYYERARNTYKTGWGPTQIPYEMSAA